MSDGEKIDVKLKRREGHAPRRVARRVGVCDTGPGRGGDRVCARVCVCVRVWACVL